MKKRLAWFAPMSTRSAMSSDSHDICSKLSLVFDVDIWSPHFDDLYKTHINVIIFNEQTNHEILNKYDYVVYNFGNYLPFHRYSYDMFVRHPGIAIIHDRLMLNFFEQYCKIEHGNSLRSFEIFLSMIHLYYGEKVRQLFYDTMTSGKSIFVQEMLRYSLLEPILDRAKGVFSHAKGFVDNLYSKYAGPIGYSYLSCEKDTKKVVDDELINMYVPRDSTKLRLVSTGSVGEVKRIDKVVDVLLENPHIALKIQYILIGGIVDEYGEKLKKISETELHGCLYMIDYQPTDVMESAIYSSDMCINLRYPNTEVCSLSLLEQMAFGKPVLVINSGVYGELPSDCVVKIDINREKEDIKTVFESLLDDTNSLITVGANAAKFVQKECTIERYADRFSEFLSLSDAVQSKEDKQLLHHLIDMNIQERAGTLCAAWNSDDYLPSILSNRISDVVPIQDYSNISNVIGVWLASDDGQPCLTADILEFINDFFTHDEVSSKYEVIVNYNELSIIEDILTAGGLKDRVSIVHECNYTEVYKVANFATKRYSDFLNAVAELSVASCFIVVNTTNYSIIKANKPFGVVLTEKFIDYLSSADIYTNHAEMRDVLWKLESLAREGGKFVIRNCKSRQQLLNLYIRNLIASNIISHDEWDNNHAIIKLLLPKS